MAKTIQQALIDEVLYPLPVGIVENIMVKEYEPFILSYIATMFFGVQFESIDKRRFKAIELTI